MSGVLLYPLSSALERTDAAFKGHIGNDARGKVFTAYLANRLLMVANQAGINQKAVKLTELDTASDQGLLCVLERADSERFLAVVQQSQLLDSLSDNFTTEVEVQIGQYLGMLGSSLMISDITSTIYIGQEHDFFQALSN